MLAVFWCAAKPMAICWWERAIWSLVMGIAVSLYRIH
jgi:hypothetical protein